MMSSIDWQTLSLQLITTFAHFLWQGALIGLVLAVLLRLCASRSSNARYVFASVAFALLPLCVGGTFAAIHQAGDPIFRSKMLSETAQPTTDQPNLLLEFPASAMADPIGQSSPALQLPQTQAADTATPLIVAKPSWSSWLTAASPYLFAVYLFGVTVRLLRLGSSVWLSGRLRRAVKKIEDSAITQIISAQATRMGLRQIPLIALCDQISVPVVVGILKPTILLPPAILCGLDPSQLAAILSHELAHIRRYDLLVNLLQRVVEALLFFHPVTWWISQRMSAEREDCCDDMAVAGCGRLEFTSALLQMAELCAKNRGLAVGSQLEAMAADGGKQTQLTRRVHRLLGEVDAPRIVLSRASIALAVATTVMFAVSVLAFAQSNGNLNSSALGESSDGASNYDETQFARPPARYTHLVYDQSVRDPERGIIPERVIQALPTRGKTAQQAVPFSENALVAGSRDSIRSSYPTFRPGESIEVKGNAVLIRNANTGSEKVIIRGVVRADRFSRILARVAISPDRKRVATAVCTGDDGSEIVRSPLFDLYVVDLSAEEPVPNVIRSGVHGDAISGGAFFPAAVAPPIFWLDDENLLVVTPHPRKPGVHDAQIYLEPGNEPTATELEDMVNINEFLNTVVVRDDGEVLTPTHNLLQISVRDNSSAKVCDLNLDTFTGMQQTSTDFWRRSDGAIMLRSRGADMRIDLTKSEAIADRNLSPQYELRGDRYKPSLWRGDEQLAEVIHFHNVGVSPDGRSVAWYTRSRAQDTTNLGNTSQYPTTLWFHSPDTGTVKLAEGRFAWDNYWDVFDNPVLNPRFRWLTQTDFMAQTGVPTKASEKAIAAEQRTQEDDAAEELQLPSHYEGTVLGPDGKPMQGAEVFVISDWNENTKLGPVRDVTDANGKFSFDAPDMTWHSLGMTRRRGGLIVAKKDGFVPEWMETWGHSRGIFSTGLWGETKRQTLELQLARDDVPVRGQLLGTDGNPLAGARVRLTHIMIPRNRDLTEFLDHWSKAHVSATFMTGINYKRQINKHFELMDLRSELVTDAEGRFELSGIGRDRIAQFEVTAPSIVTTRIQVMTRESESVGILLDGFEGKGNPTQTIYGANFSAKLKPGLTVAGVVRDRETKQPIAGMWVTTGGYSPLTAPQQTDGVVVTDADGRFTIRGLDPKLLEYEKESTRSISAIPQPGVLYLKASTFFAKDQDTVIETVRGIGYRLQVVDENGEPVRAKVEYLRIHPNSIGLEMIDSVGGGADGFLNHAALSDDGTYQGFVLPGPGAVVVSVPGNKYRPASVDPKKFFAPGKTWHDSSTYTYGTHSVLATGGGWTDPRQYEAVILVNPSPDSEPLDLTATLLRDRPRTISLVDSEGQPVFGAIARMHERRGTSHVDETISGSSFPLEGLNVDKDQWITFLHEERKLATVVAIRGDSDAAVTVQLQPWGTVKGRIVDEKGQPIVISGKSEFSTIVKNAAHGAIEYFAHTVNEDGTFEIEGFASGQTYSTNGTYGNRKNVMPDGMFKGLVLQPGEVRDLGDVGKRQVGFALVGMMDLDGDGEDDINQVRESIKDAGGRIDEELGPHLQRSGAGMYVQTSYLVLGTDLTLPANASAEQREEHENRIRAYAEFMSEAKQYGIIQISLAKLMGFIKPEAQ